MRTSPDTLVRDPEDGSELQYVGLGESGDGVLVNARSGRAYPVLAGVPVMLPDAFPAEFTNKHRSEIAALPELADVHLGASHAAQWSFSREWDAHFGTDSDRTWGYTVQDRVDQFFMENQVSADDLGSMRVLDAGCGNGSLTDSLGRFCKQIVGLDYSSGARGAEKARKSESAYFVQGDLMSPPLPHESFDLVFSIGVLHHTPNTKTTFDSVARLVKPGGKLYVWLYRRPERFLGRSIKVPIYDAMRAVVSRLPPRLQDIVVHAYARLVRGFHNLRGGENPIPLREYVVSAFDDLACRWRYYHTPAEVAGWLHEAGFGPPTLTHWDNPYGFGVVAERRPQPHTPGIHYGDGVKLWDDEQTLLGRLHRD